MKIYATMHDTDGNHTSNCRIVYATSKRAAAELLRVKPSQVYIYS